MKISLIYGILSLMKMFNVKKGVNGLGLFTTTDWKKGDKMIEYVGEIISVEEADRRGGKYLFEINKRWTIDGKARENVARYINHSCSPNCETEVDGKKVFVYALKKITPGEEMTYDYGKEYFNEYIKPKGCRCPKCLAKSGPKSLGENTKNNPKKKSTKKSNKKSNSKSPKKAK